MSEMDQIKTDNARKKRVWITVGLLFAVAAAIYLAFIGRGVFGWFA